MDTLERALRDAADDAPDRLVDEPTWAERSWRRGRRQRRLRQVATGAGVAAALLVVAGLVLSLTVGVPRVPVPADGADGARSGGATFPQRIGHQWVVRDLPESGTRVAALVQVLAGDVLRWQAVSGDGTRYDLPLSSPDVDVYPAVSRDGWRVAWFQTALDRWLARDLRTGATWFFAEVGLGGAVRSTDDPRGQPDRVADVMAPAFFSPDGDALAVPTQDGPTVLRLGPGSVVAVDGMADAAGWLDADRLLGRVDAGGDPTAWDRETDLVVWDRRTGRTEQLGTVTVPAPGPDEVATPRDRSWGSLRSDGTLWLAVDLTTADGTGASAELVGFDARTLQPGDLAGTPVPEPVGVPADAGVLAAQQWRRDVPLRGVVDGVREVWADERALVVVQSAALSVQQVVFAQDAIDGSPSWTPFGTTDLVPLWWWREILLVALAAIGWRWWVRRRRARPRADAASPPSPAGS